MFYVYVLRSKTTGKHYKGHTSDVPTRVQQHNRGKTRSTKSGVPWEVIHTETVSTRAAAVERERYFKSLAGGKELRRTLGANPGGTNALDSS